MIKKLVFSAAAAATALTAVPSAAAAAYHPAYEQAYRDRAPARDVHYDGGRRCTGTTGTLLGAVAGGLLGRHVGTRHGSRATGTILGGAAGALAGRAADKHLCRRR